MVMVTLIEKQNRSKRARAKRAAEKSSKSAKPVHASARHSCGKGKTPKANEEDFELVVIEEEQRRELEHRHQEKQEQVSAKAWRSWHNQKEQVQEQVSAKAWPSWHNQEEQVQEQVSAKAWPSCHNQEEQLVPVQTWPSWHWHHAEDQEQVSAQTRPSWHWHHEEDQEHQEPVPVETLWHWHHEEDQEQVSVQAWQARRIPRIVPPRWDHLGEVAADVERAFGVAVELAALSVAQPKSKSKKAARPLIRPRPLLRVLPPRRDQGSIKGTPPSSLKLSPNRPKPSSRRTQTQPHEAQEEAEVQQSQLVKSELPDHDREDMIACVQVKWTETDGNHEGTPPSSPRSEAAIHLEEMKPELEAMETASDTDMIGCADCVDSTKNLTE